MHVIHRPRLRATFGLLLACGLYAGAAGAEAISGAIFTTNASGIQVNGNNYSSKGAVYLNGGPANAPGCNGGALEDGDYYFQVTNPSGSVLLSTDGIAARAFRVQGGEISQNLGTHAHGLTGPCGGLTIRLLPFANTPNPGGVYKVWITRISDFNAACTQLGGPADCGLAGFVPGNTKTDNFRVACIDPPYTGSLRAYKFYDHNANGLFDAGDIPLPDWKMTATSQSQSVDSTHFTGATGSTTFNLLTPANDYFVTEGTPVEGNWVNSATIYTGHDGSPQNPAGPLSVVSGYTTVVKFGNYCTFLPGGLTLGFWSNKNGQALVDSGDLTLLSGLNLVDGAGNAFNPADYTSLRDWLLNGTAVNMAYMLSVQLAAMELNVANNKVNGSDFYVPAQMTINQLMAAANTSLGNFPLTLDGNSHRADQEQLKNWLDELNNNAPVLSPTPCAYSFY
jgi:hypothetical protein